jgi:hypothetical protein
LLKEGGEKMKKVIIIIGFMTMGVCVCPIAVGADKEFDSSGQILAGETWDNVVIRNDNTIVDMLGGQIGRPNTSDSLSAYDNSVFNMLGGQITVMYIMMNSIGTSKNTINISGGTTDVFLDFVFGGGSYGLISDGSVTAGRLKVYYDSVIDIRGGLLQVNDFDMVGYDKLPTVNIYGYGFNYSGGVVSGYLRDSNPFSIGGVSELEYSHFNLIPEPTTLLLLGFGCCLCRCLGTSDEEG